ncbi:MAG: FAD:protein FMN transferase [Muribaculaceae bacterium]|nr:FAD:protein FMN transferase [Muribaculaceae bacterium]
MKRLFPLTTAAVAAYLMFMAPGCSNSSGHTSGEYHKVSGEMWHTIYNVTYAGPESLEDSIKSVLDEVGASLSAFDSTSVVSRVNRLQATHVDRHFKAVYRISNVINIASDGAFDPTLAPLIKAWGFGEGHKATADTLRLDSLLAMTGISRTRLNGNTLYKDDPRITFNFSAIAKGYGADCVGAMLKRNGVTDFLVEIGGEIVSSGHNSKGADWRVAITRPVPEAETDSASEDPQAVLSFSAKAIATSGNYRNFHEEGALRYGHTISPATGRPAATDVASVTVMGPTCMEADAVATAAMALGSRRATAMLDSLEFPYYIVLTDFSTIISETMRPYVVK